MLDSLNSPEIPLKSIDLVRLSKETGSLIDNLNPELPTVFKQEAKRTSQRITLLDTNQGLDDPETKKWLNQLGQTYFARFPYLRKIYPKLLEKSTSDVRLPYWLEQDFLVKQNIIPKSDSLTKERIQEINHLYEKLVKELKFTHETIGADIVYRLNQQVQTTPRSCKFYLEGDRFYQALKNESLKKLLEFLKDKPSGVSFNKMKLHDIARLVLGVRDINESTLLAAFSKIQSNIPFRGPAQDVFQVVPDGSLLKIIYVQSNDSLFGESPPMGQSGDTYNLPDYSPEGFLKLYLNLCGYGGKNPSLPYQTSFVHLVDGEGKLSESVSEAITKTQALTSYPAVYSKYRSAFPVFKT